MIDDIKLSVKPRNRAAEFLRSANARLHRAESRDLQYTFGLFLSVCVQLLLAFNFAWITGERRINEFDVLVHNENIVLAGLALLPVLAAIRRGDLAQRIAAIPLAIFPLGVLVHYTHWALALLERLRQAP